MIHDVIDVRGPRGIWQKNLQKIETRYRIFQHQKEQDNLQRISDDKKIIISVNSFLYQLKKRPPLNERKKCYDHNKPRRW